MQPALETLLRPFSHGDLAIPSRALFLGSQPHPDLRAWPEITGWQPFKPFATAWDTAGFARIGEVSGTYPLVLVLPGKSRDETLAWFAKGYDHLEEGGLLVVAMPNTAGASRFEKELADASGGIESFQKNKCRVFHARKSPAWNLQLLATWRDAGIRHTLPGTDFVVEAGIFSSDHADPGSLLLTKHLPASLKGTVADLGAGWGFLSHHIATNCPKVSQLDLYEADARALDCARQNLSELQVPLRFLWHDVTTGIEGPYDAIVINPPFHLGQATDVELGRNFLRAAAAGLRRGGNLYLVANKQLPYERELDALNLRWRKPVEDSTFKLLFASK